MGFPWLSVTFPVVFPPDLPTAAHSTADPPTPSRSDPGHGSLSPTPTRVVTGRLVRGAALPPSSFSWQEVKRCLSGSPPWAPGTVPTQPANECTA